MTEAYAPDDLDGTTIIFCGGGAKPGDTHLASTIHCVDDEIIEWVERRERRRRDRNIRLSLENRHTAASAQMVRETIPDHRRWVR
jgi:hypothetical protein